MTTTFVQLGLPPRLVGTLIEGVIIEAFPVQATTIHDVPPSLSPSHDRPRNEPRRPRSPRDAGPTGRWKGAPMTAPYTTRTENSVNFNHLSQGTTYRATTLDGTTVGEYLGMEHSHGDRAMLLRHRNGTQSLLLHDVTAIVQAAA